jgi:hypothetical protein
MEGSDDDEWFLYDGAQSDDVVAPDDLPWFGTPWPPYLPRPDGSWIGINRDNIMLCTPKGWRWVAARVFDLCERVPGVEIIALSQHRGRLLVRIGNRAAAVDDEEWQSVGDRFALGRLEAASERLCNETLKMCEVCGGPVSIPAGVPRPRTLCNIHVGGQRTTVDDDDSW